MTDYSGPERRSDAVEIAALKVEVEHLKSNISEIRADVKDLIKFVNEHKGGVKVLCIVASAGGAVGALLMKFLPTLTNFK